MKYHNILFLSALTLLTHLTVVSAKSCPIGNCNNAGNCYMEGGQTKCSCIGDYFGGTRCKEYKNACDSNPCSNGATCEPGLGQFLCKCAGTWGGQRCDVKDKATFTKMHVLFNPIGTYGEKQNFLLTVETLGKVDAIYEAFTNNCLIDTFESHPESGNSGFRYSKDLKSIARSLSLSHEDRLPYTVGYYHKSYDTFWEVGMLNVTVRAVEESTLYGKSFDIFMIQPPSVSCIPDVSFMHGHDPQELMMIDIARFNIFNAIIHKHCASDSRFEISWTVHDSIGTVQLHDFGNTGKRQLKVKPYRLRFKNSGVIAQSYMVRANVDEFFSGKVVHKKARCYISVMPKPVASVILGGSSREVGIGQSFFLDGSRSRDFGLSPLVEQTMSYKWECESSEDSSNPYCQKHMGTGDILNIPAGVLKVGTSYTFSLVTESFVSVNMSSKAKQTIKIISEPKHYVYIECIRNCAINMFAAERKIYLRMRCPTCLVAPTINWKVSGGGDGGGNPPSKTHRLGFMPPTSGSVTIEVSVTSGTMDGKCVVELEHNEPPQGGKCSIEPSSGVEYETEFHIECKDFDDHDWPLSYQYIADTFTFDRTNERLLYTRLPKTSNIKVIVCDFLQACTDTKIQVSVSAMQMPQNEAELKELLLKPDYNIGHLLGDGDVEKAMVLIFVFSSRIRTVIMWEIIFYHLIWFRLETLLQVEQLTRVTRNLITTLKPLDYKKVRLFVRFFRKISWGFYYIIVDWEFRELSPDSYDLLNNEVVDMIAEFSAKLEDMPPIVRIEPVGSGGPNRLGERYVPLPDFDETVLQRIESWLDVIFESFRCLHFVGILGTIMHEPSDDHYKLDKPGVKVEVFTIEGMQRMNMETNNRKIMIIIPSSMLAELELMLHSTQLLFQVISFERNPFWWYPDTEPLNTGIVAFSVYSLEDPLREETHIKHPIEFRMTLEGGDEEEEKGKQGKGKKEGKEEGNKDENREEGGDAPTSNTTTPTSYLVEGYVNDSNDMPIYRIEMPVNTAAIVKFTDPTTRLCVKLNLCTKPRSYQVRASEDKVPDKDTFHIVNNKGGNAWAYLAVMAADAIDSRETFKFKATMLKCLVWDFKLRDPEWSTVGCVPKLNMSDTKNLTCSCYHMSTYAGKKHSTSARETDAPRRVLTHLPINIYSVIFFLFLILLFTLLFLWAYYSLLNHKGDLITLLSQEDSHREFGVYVHISTGGHWNASTTANIILMFALPTECPRKFIVYQNPESPHLVRNSTCTLRLPINGDDIVQPLLLSIRRDNAGRYPSWYCRNVVIEDYSNEIICTFEVEDWITTKPLVLDASNFQEGQSRKRRFRTTLESNFIQWFLFQALIGPWKYGEMPLNRFERTCIWTVKLALIICIVTCYMGPTTLDTYEEERDLYRNIAYDWSEIFFLCIFSYVICFFVEMGLKAFIYHDELKTEEIEIRETRMLE